MKWPPRSRRQWVTLDRRLGALRRERISRHADRPAAHDQTILRFSNGPLLLTPGLEAFVRVDEGREDVRAELLELKGLIVGLGEGALIVGQVNGELALQLQTQIGRLLLEIDLAEGQGGLGGARHGRLLGWFAGSGRSP